MPLRLRNTILFLLLGAAALGSWLLRPVRPLADAVTATSGSLRGYYMNDAVFSGLDETGRIIYRLAATHIEGSDDTAVLSLREVEISYAPELDVPWVITARAARTERGTDLLELSDVVIESIADGTRDRTRIEADDLRLDPEQQFASAAGPVSFAIGDSRIEAVGLSADLRAERISLESRVSGRVVP